jgi:hypothetical protein
MKCTNNIATQVVKILAYSSPMNDELRVHGAPSEAAQV